MSEPNISKKRILITGKNSRIGKAFCQFIEEHYPGMWEMETTSLREKAYIAQDWSGFDAIVHAAGISKTDTGALSQEEMDQYFQVNTELTWEIAQKAKAEGVGQFLYLSTMMVYGNSAPIGKDFEIDAATLPEPASTYGKSKLKAEERIKSLEDDSFVVTIVREPIVYGESFQGEFYKLQKLARVLPVFPRSDSRKSYIYQGNLCELLRLLIQQKYSGVVCPQNLELPTTSELFREMALAYGKHPLILGGCIGLLTALSKVFPIVNAVMNDMTYRQELSTIEGLDYQIYSLEESIKRCKP